MQGRGTSTSEELIVNPWIDKQNQPEVNNFSCEWYGLNYVAQILLGLGSSVKSLRLPFFSSTPLSQNL